MPVTFVDQVMANLATSANRATFVNTIGLAAFAQTSFSRRYGTDGVTVDNVALGPVEDFQLRQETLGWVDATFTTQADLSIHAVPGSVAVGATADVASAGWQPASAPMTSQSKFLLALSTDQITLSYAVQVNVFISAAPSPTEDLRRIETLRRFFEADPTFLVSLDGTPEQRPFLFVQIYPGGALNGGPLAPAAIAQLFDAADVLAAFLQPPT